MFQFSSGYGADPDEYGVHNLEFRIWQNVLYPCGYVPVPTKLLEMTLTADNQLNKVNPLLYGRGVIYPAYFQSCP
jgi:hypothetical protein